MVALFISGEFELLLPNVSCKLNNRLRETLYPKEERSEADGPRKSKNPAEFYAVFVG